MLHVEIVHVHFETSSLISPNILISKAISLELDCLYRNNRMREESVRTLW